MAWNCIGTKLASGSVDQTARVWHIEPHGHVSFHFMPTLCDLLILIGVMNSIDVCEYLLKHCDHGSFKMLYS